MRSRPARDTSLVDALFSVALLLALAAPVGLAAAWFSGRGAEAMSSLFKTDRGLGWPHGVQEEDVAWNWDHRPAAEPDSVRAPLVEPVAFRMGRGSARGGKRGPLPR
jgi:hypothetical protein